MDSPVLCGEDEPGRATLGGGELVLVPVGLAGDWKGQGMASPTTDSSGRLHQREDREIEGAGKSCDTGEEAGGSGGLGVKGDRGNKGAAKKVGQQQVKKRQQVVVNMEGGVLTVGADQGSASSAKNSPSKPKWNSPGKSKPSSSRGLPIGPGCCCGSDLQLQASEGGVEKAESLGKQGSEGDHSVGGLSGGVPIPQGRVQKEGRGAPGSPGRGTLGQRGGQSGMRRKGGTKGGGWGSGGEGSGTGSPAAASGTSRDGSRSPVGLRKSLGGGEQPSGVRLPVKAHGECVARVRKAVLGGVDDGGGVGRGEGGNELPSVGH